jgi:GT2 family glycosyltransferase/glycosyltransferase involved in cell wall biosynthesis
MISLGNYPLNINVLAQSISLTENIQVEWKASGTAEELNVKAEGIQADPVDRVQITTPLMAGWIRLSCPIERASDKPLMGLRMVLKVRSKRGAASEPIRPMFAVRDDTGKKALPVTSQDIVFAGAGWCEIRSLFVCDPNLKELTLLINLPKESSVSIAALDTTWFDADLSDDFQDTLEANKIVPARMYSMHSVDDNALAKVLEFPPIFGMEVTASRFDARGWVLGPKGDISLDCATVSNRTAVSADSEVSLIEGVNIQSGFTLPLTNYDESDDKLFVSLSSNPDRILAQLELPKLLSNEQAGSESSARTTPTKLFYFPDYTATNPYQSLMYHSLPDTVSQSGTIDDAINEIENAGASAKIVMHLHWLNPVLKGSKTAQQASVQVQVFLDKLRYFVHRGGVVLWTVHNLVSHGLNHHDLQIELAQAVADLATHIHVHSATLLPELAKHYRISKDKLLIEPHPNYISHYPNYSTREAARNRFNLPQDAKVYLFFGQLRPYKGIDQLVRDFNTLRGSDTDAQLLIVGRPSHPYKPGMLNRKFQGMVNVHVIEGHVDDNALQWYYNACDWVVLPYNNILTSGSLLCALSFSRPVIAPDLGMITDVLKTGHNGITYDPEEPTGLLNALKAASATKPAALDKMRKAALESVEPLNWANMGTGLQGAINRSYNFRTKSIAFQDGQRECILTGPDFPPATSAGTAVIILNYEHLDDVQRLISTLRGSTVQDFDIYVVDNCSPNLSPFDLAIDLPDVHVLRLPQNLGYGAGNNAALRLISDLSYEFVWILNPDMVVSPQALEQHINAANAHPEISIFGPAIMRGGNGNRVASAGGYLSIEGGLSTGHMYSGDTVSTLPATPYTADFITGAAIFLRKAVLDKIGLIPEEYFLYFEETHWLTEAARKGEPCMVLPDIHLAHHKRSQEGGLPAKYYFYYFVRNSLIFATRMSSENANVTLSRLRNSFISAWLKKIKERAPTQVAIYARIAEQAVIDGLAGKTGQIDLIALQLSAQDLPVTKPADLQRITCDIDDGGVMSGTIELSNTREAAIVTLVHNGTILEQTTCSISGPSQKFSLNVPTECRVNAPQTFDFYINNHPVPEARMTRYLSRPDPEFAARIDGLRQFCCIGWAIDKNNPDQPVMVELLHEGEVIGRGTADTYRKDLARNNIGDGHAGFAIRLPRAFCNGNKFKLQLRIVGASEILNDREVADNSISGGVVPTRVQAALNALFYDRQFWFASHDLEDIPLGRYLAQTQSHLSARHIGQNGKTPVSVILATTQDAGNIANAVEAVRQQTHRNWELLIIDDGTVAEEAATLVKDIGDTRIRLVEVAQNTSTPAARNEGLRQASGEIIAYLNSNAIWSADFLSVMVGELLAQSADVNAAYCGQKIQHAFGEDENPREELIALRMGEFRLPLLENRNYIDLTCFVHRRSAFEDLAGFNEGLHSLDDWELILRYAQQAVPHYVPALLSASCITGAPLVQTDPAENLNLLRETISRSLPKQLTSAAAEKRFVDVVLMAQDVEISLQERINDLLDRISKSDTQKSDARLIVYAGPAATDSLPKDLHNRITLRPSRTEDGEVLTSGAILADVLTFRNADADLAVLHANALPVRGWLAGFDQAMTKVGGIGMMISRQTVKGKDVRATKSVPFSSPNMDVCIALSSHRRNVVTPNLAQTGSMAELSGFDPFCVYVPSATASTFCTPDVEADMNTAFGEWADFTRHYLDQKLVYCGNVQVYDEAVI